MNSIISKSAFANNKLTRNDKIEIGVIIIASIIISVMLFKFAPGVYAAQGITPQQMDDLIDKVITIVCGVTGALFILTGIVKYAISHANEDGPAQQKAIMMLATGIVLVALAIALPNITQATWYQFS